MAADDRRDGIDRRGFLECMTWAGTGLVWAAAGGVLTSSPVAAAGRRLASAGDLTFAQISDSHIGFDKAANADVTATLAVAIDRVNALTPAPDFVIHTGDLTHLSRPREFDTLQQSLKSLRTSAIFFVPGEHDVIGDNGAEFLARHGRGTQGRGWFSFDHKGVHFIGLVNVLDLKAGGLGRLGQDQLDWLARDVRRLSASTPIVLFAHIPLWSVYPQWGWGTDDGAQALRVLRRFGSVTVLNGHIHQVLQKIEGGVTFHTAASTAFPQPVPGSAPSPGPVAVPPGRLRDVLGVADVTFRRGSHGLAVVDAALSSHGAAIVAPQSVGAGVAAAAPQASTAAAPAPASAVSIDNFTFDPRRLEVSRGATVTWTNRDDVPHTVTSTTRAFGSKALDTGDRFTHTFDAAGTFDYYCTIHPTMTGSVSVK